MCFYCDPKNFTGVCLDDSNFCEMNKLESKDWTALYIVYNGENNKFGLYASGEDHVTFPINYCPVCGRNL